MPHAVVLVRAVVEQQREGDRVLGPAADGAHAVVCRRGVNSRGAARVARALPATRARGVPVPVRLGSGADVGGC